MCDQCQELKQELEQAKEQTLRIAADFDNYRKRTNREIEDTQKRATQDVIKKLLPVFDNLEQATYYNNSSTKDILDGLNMVNEQFLSTLSKLGIERIEAIGQPFDPNFHESIHYQESNKYDADIVINVLQPGYCMGKDLLRAATVIVSKRP